MTTEERKLIASLARAVRQEMLALRKELTAELRAGLANANLPVLQEIANLQQSFGPTAKLVVELEADLTSHMNPKTHAPQRAHKPIPRN